MEGVREDPSSVCVGTCPHTPLELTCSFDEEMSPELSPDASPMLSGSESSTSAPRRPLRAVAQPQRLDATQQVVCYRYSQGRAAAADGRWHGRSANLHYFLPENWCASYKFSVFEDSYVLSFADDAEPSAGGAEGGGHPGRRAPPRYHLARPLGMPPPADMPPTREFELVWPLPCDRHLIDSIEVACDRVVPGAKRKMAPLSLNSGQQLLQKLQKLDL